MIITILLLPLGHISNNPGRGCIRLRVGARSRRRPASERAEVHGSAAAALPVDRVVQVVGGSSDGAYP